MTKKVAFLRGINVGGHHKVPMKELRSEMKRLGFKNVETVLNSGNVIFDCAHQSCDDLSNQLENKFGFPIPAVIREYAVIATIWDLSPFNGIDKTSDHRFYATFLPEGIANKLSLPWNSPDGSLQIIEKHDDIVFSVLDLSISKTPKAMEHLEKHYGKNITTRNWNTIERIVKKVESLNV